MANGANRLFKVFTETSKATNTIPSQMVSLTVKSIQPLIFTRDDRLEIPEEFCLFSKLIRKEDIKVGDIVTAMAFNEGQNYFIEHNDNDNLIVASKEELDEILVPKVGADWRLKSGVYHYEAADKTTLDLPFEHVQVLTLNRGGNRGVALAMRWADNKYYLWMNRLHDDTSQNNWAGWVQVYEEKNQITYNSWHNVILTRSDSDNILLILYGTDSLKEGNYSIANAFKLETIGTVNATLTVPLSAVTEIRRYDYGFEIVLSRSAITADIHSRTSREYNNDYNGIAIVRDGNLVLQSN